jgi:beta-glucanase (GH16 family)
MPGRGRQASAALYAAARETPQRNYLGRALPDDAWVLTWGDDFTGPGLNLTNWTPRNNESHCEPCEPELYLASNVAVANGTLVLTTKRDSVMGPDGLLYNFSSGWVDTQNKFAQQYGRWAVSAKLPPQNATGAWPAHWLMPANTCA